jgi:hypothetical protein
VSGYAEILRCTCPESSDGDESHREDCPVVAQPAEEDPDPKPQEEPRPSPDDPAWEEWIGWHDGCSWDDERQDFTQHSGDCEYPVFDPAKWTSVVKARERSKVEGERVRERAVAEVAEEAAHPPLPPRAGYSRLYVVRWERTDGRPRSKVFRRFQSARNLAKKLEAEKTTPGQTFNLRKGRSMQKSPVEWVRLDMSYVLNDEMGPTKTCECCGEEFYPNRSDQRYSDTAHRMRAYRERAVSERYG